jgi:undecaprenyl diphosphate synthase
MRRATSILNNLKNLDELAKAGTPERQLLSQVDFSRLPRHVAVIMDGNGRWAKARNLPRVEGHRAGVQSVADTVEAAARMGIKVLTLYAFSVENWKRPKNEVNTLMRLLKQYLKKELDTLQRNNIKLSTIGRIHELAPSIQRDLERAVQVTSANTGTLLNIALNYGGRSEILDAVRSIVTEHQENGNGSRPIDEETIRRHLYTAGIPDPDLLIRTSGEMRVSNFLLWQIAYAEIWITPTLWPDFRRKDLFQAIVDFQRRERRFGGV